VPLAGIENDREVLFIWERADHPAATATSEALAIEAPATAPAKTPAKTPVKTPVSTP